MSVNKVPNSELQVKFNLLDKFKDSDELKQFISETIQGIVGSMNTYNWSKQVRQINDVAAMQSIIIDGHKVEVDQLFHALKQLDFQPCHYQLTCTVQLEKKATSLNHGN